MAASQLNEIVQHLRRTVLARNGSELTDGQLLQDYISRRNEAALAAIVGRHGPMVWGVCRRLLFRHHDAEDAFQAVFLVLVRKAASIVPREMVANWLYGVTYQTALRARANAAKRRARERQISNMPEPAADEPKRWHDLQAILDEELSRLPDIYRSAVVLCDLDGKTRKEAARHLRCPEGTVASRLAKGRRMLAKRLARHGFNVSGGAMAVLIQKVAAADVPTSVVSITIKAASAFAAGHAATKGALSAQAVALTEGMLKTMLLTKLKVLTAVLVAASVIALGGGLFTNRTASAQSSPDAPRSAQSPAGEPASKDTSRPAPKTDDVTEPPALAQGKEAIKKEKQKLEGLWQDCENGDTYQFQGNIIEWHSKRDNQIRKWPYRLDLSQTPPAIDIFSHIDNGPGGTGRGIYELDGDDLTIAYVERNGARATKFERGGGTTLLVLKRVKQPAPRTDADVARLFEWIVERPNQKAVEQDDALRHVELIKWNLLRVEVDERTLHIADVPAERTWGRGSAEWFLASGGSQLSLRKLPVAKDARITLDGKAIELKDLHHGVNLSLKLAVDKPVVTAISATTPERAGYIVKEVKPDSTIVVTRGKEGKPLVLTVPANALIQGQGVNTFKDLKAGMYVQLHVEIEDGKMVAKQVRVR